jgi:hypothetical protein
VDSGSSITDEWLRAARSCTVLRLAARGSVQPRSYCVLPPLRDSVAASWSPQLLRLNSCSSAPATADPPGRPGCWRTGARAARVSSTSVSIHPAPGPAAPGVHALDHRIVQQSGKALLQLRQRERLVGSQQTAAQVVRVQTVQALETGLGDPTFNDRQAQRARLQRLLGQQRP